MHQRLWKTVESGEEYWHCHLIVDDRVVGHGEAKVHKHDTRPDGTASTLAFQDFSKRMGQDIRYDNPADAPPKGTRE